MPLSAAKINIHITTGGTLFSEDGVPSRLPSYVGSTPAPIVPGTEDVLDCNAIAEENPDYLKTTEAGALCNAVAQVQQHIKDPVELDVEFIFVDPLLTFGTTNTVGGSLTINYSADPSQENKNQYAIGFDSMINQLQKKNARDEYQNPLIAHLPNYNNLNLILPNNPYYQNNPAYPDGKWKPRAISLASAQLKALGINPSQNPFRHASESSIKFYFKNSNVDFGMLITDTSLPSATRVWDFDISDGLILQGPYSMAVYNSINFTNPATWPPGFNTTSPKSYFDFQGIVMHELLHGLGFISNVGEGRINLPPPANTSVEGQRITLLDLFRVKDSDVASMNNLNDFREVPRFLSLDQIPLPYCNQSLGTAVAVLDYSKEGFHSAPLANGRYLGSPAAAGGDGRQASHYRSPYNKVPRTGPNDCNSSSLLSAKGLFYFEDPPGRMMRPGSGYHDPLILTRDDLAALDVIGWDIDYNGNQSTVLDPVNPFDLNTQLMSQEAFESANGVDFKQSIHEIVE